MEISDCTSSSQALFETEKISFEEISQTPKGLASVPDSIHAYPIAPKPNCFMRIAISLALVFFHLVTWSFQLVNWILKAIFGGESRQEGLYQKLHYLSKEGDMGGIRQFLEEHAEEPFAAGYLFSEFVHLPELHSHLAEILQGANICLVGDGGFFCRRWREHPDCYQCPSSHNYKEGQCFAIGHFLFWEDLDGSTRFQFENSPLRGFFGWIHHMIDFLRYRRDNEQQGVTGTSLHTEDYCLKVNVDSLDFTSRKGG